ncbi:cinnamoyl-CoA reductase 1-like [Daucus carota subsp. sativus]|uniref:cinnamoyl-CoA reductase 1-like n=1 Tax=Daucus carota subsp. sativus TaxID=79200 RepID=UPI0007EFD3B0|nr:PREDICTED: cinnamoyl-CoA reductase 2-like [Daucus carota subsp. sativus]
MAQKGTVCVTGAGGYIGSWVVKVLLSNNYVVHGTVRDPGSTKYSHLTKLEKASENLKLFKADLLDFDSLLTAIRGCDGVFHVASPVPATAVQNPEVELLEPAVKGTLNVLKACSEVKVKRVVLVSSVAAIAMNPSWPKGKLMDETSWSDKEFCRKIKSYYSLSKTEAESEAWEFARQSGIDLVTVCPSLVWGPLLQSTTNSSSLSLINIMKEGLKEMANNMGWYVDVRDVADALLLAYEKPEAEGRYICSAHAFYKQDLVEFVRKLYPNYNYPKSFTAGDGVDFKPNSEKLEKLGLSYRPLEETIKDSVESYRQSGCLD